MKLTRFILLVFAVQMVPAIVAICLQEWTALAYVLASAVSAWVVGLVLAFRFYENRLGAPRFVTQRDRGR